MDIKEIKDIAHLARLEMGENQAQSYAKNMTNILHLVEQINASDCTDVEPLASPLELNQRAREDVVTETNKRDIYQSVAPKTEAGLYLVPLVIDAED